MNRLFLSLLPAILAGCTAAAATPSIEPEAKISAAPPAAAAAPAMAKPSWTTGPTLGAPPTAWRVDVSGGGPSVILNRNPYDGMSPWFEWVGPPGITAWSVSVSRSSGRLQFTQNEMNRSTTHIAAFGPMASYSGIAGQGTWAGRTIDLTPIP